MDIALWIVQGLLAFAFAMAGFMKLSQPKEKLVVAQPWTEDFSDTQIKGIGVLEVLAAIGLILPMLLGILPVLAPLAAVGLVLVMIGAAYTHIRRSEIVPNVVINLVLMTLALVVVVGRFLIEPVI
ncbi:MAG: DoxX family protein [Chloroflexi bacterium]|nr:DoxX family protein [Chloroflexota bacterium]